MHSVSRGKYCTLKYRSLGLGIYNMTDCSTVKDHCINYDQVREIETAQAELAQYFQSNAMGLPIQPTKADSVASLLYIILFELNIVYGILFSKDKSG